MTRLGLLVLIVWVALVAFAAGVILAYGEWVTGALALWLATWIEQSYLTGKHHQRTKADTPT